MGIRYKSLLILSEPYSHRRDQTMMQLPDNTNARAAPIAQVKVALQFVFATKVNDLILIT